ncbi:MAG: glycosyltransferase [Lachnospiraceae bacterium]|nr:glycosyltransferase [uncultured Acetatifactor sp.]MCI9571868.1 glycosyltransferase [Lachnospiraceae bacterium]
MKILFLTNLLPYPLDNGGKIKTYTTLQGLSRADYSVDLVCFTEDKMGINDVPIELSRMCNRVEQIFLRLTTAENKKYMMQTAMRSLFSKCSFGLYKYKSQEMVLKLKKLSESTRYDCIYYDHLQMCIYKPYLDALFPGCKTVLDEHNCETLIILRNAQNSSNIVKRLFLYLEAYKLRYFEARCLNTVDASIVLSQEDYRMLRGLCKNDFPHKVIPIGVQDRGIKQNMPIEKCLNILFIGTLTWEPNNKGMQWFLREVVPLLDASGFQYSLYIVGKNPSRELKELIGVHDNIFLTGYVDSIDEYYDKCHCMVVPLFIGSGQRVKIIEAFSKGMPVVSTSIGAEGLRYSHGDNILIADNADEFVHNIVAISEEQRKKISVMGRQTYEEHYSPGAVQAKILGVIDCTVNCKQG